ncbi:hypothetical protein F4804DRAFT_350569 [Jackrogersella minutella]|nr:hypothetical protein F4804DRAFT_350569 [Jackrogersella minutella]
MDTESTSQAQIVRGRGPWAMSDILKLPNTQELITVLGADELQYAFSEYLTIHPSPEPIVAKDIIARVYAMVGWPEPTFTNLYKWARDPPTDEPWPEALFAWRVKRYLEGRDCKAVDWTLIDYYRLSTAEERRYSRVIALERYQFVIEILERMLRATPVKTLANFKNRPEHLLGSGWF